MYIDLISFIYYRLFTLPFPCRPKASRYAGHGKEKGRGEGESEGETLEAPLPLLKESDVTRRERHCHLPYRSLSAWVVSSRGHIPSLLGAPNSSTCPRSDLVTLREP